MGVSDTPDCNLMPGHTDFPDYEAENKKLREANRRLQDSCDSKIDALEEQVKDLKAELDDAYRWADSLAED